MKLRAFSRIGDPAPIVKDVAVVLVEDDGGTPIAVSVCLGKGKNGHEIIFTAHAEDEEFNEVLKQLHIGSLVVLGEDVAGAPQVPDGARPIVV